MKRNELLERDISLQPPKTMSKDKQTKRMCLKTHEQCPKVAEKENIPGKEEK